jgi:tetratricopeptide (TPR) repeat protein
MANEDQADNLTPEDELDPDFESSVGKRDRGWRDLWQAPALLLGFALLITGLMTIRSTAPTNDFDGALEDIETLLVRQEFQRALTMLNGQILPELDGPDARPAHRRKFFLLRADAIFSGQELSLTESSENYQAIVADYSRAEELLAELSPSQVSRLATSLVALGREKEALRRAEQIPASLRSARVSIIEQLIDQNLAKGEIEEEWTRTLLAALSNDEGLTEEEQIWTVARTARLDLALGRPDDALTYLLRSIQRVSASGGPLAGDLYLLLARSYYELGRFSEALRNVERAEAHLPPTGSARGDALTLAGQILQVAGDLEDARDRFAIALSRYPALISRLEAQLGLAEVESEVGRLAQSIRAYEDLIAMLNDPPRRAREPVSRDDVAVSLLDRRQERLALNDLDHALEFAELAKAAFGLQTTPGPVILALADSHRLIAERMLTDAGEQMSARNVLALDPATRATVRAHLLEAGRSYLQHARQVILADDARFGDSLWMAGDSFDLGGDRESAIGVFSEFVNGRPADPRRPEAIFRLAQAHQSLGGYAAAAGLYENLIAEHPRSPEAAASHVLLAQTYLHDGEPGNNAEAERLLTAILEGGSLTPEAIEYRDALAELGSLYLARGDFDKAAVRLREAAERYPNDPDTVHVRFKLAESLRLGAAEIADSLRDAMPSGRRSELQESRRTRLQTALALYDEVRATLERESPTEVSDLDRVTLRNAYYYRSDCAFDLGQYEQAIAAYDAAAQRYADDPASLVAMMQIVNCYMELDRWAEARTANERARRRLAELPDDILDSPDLPLDRRHWERWLESTETLSRRASADDAE